MQFEIMRIFPSINPFRLKEEPFHDLIKLYIKTADKVSRDNKKEKQNNMNNFKGNFSNQKGNKPYDKMNDPEYLKKKYGTIIINGKEYIRRPDL